jgi:hypothetical protein
MRNRNTKLTALEPQTTYRVVVLVRYTGASRNSFGKWDKRDLPMKTYVSNGKTYQYQEFELWGPYLSPNVAHREAKTARGYEGLIYPEDVDVIIEEQAPVWTESEVQLNA